MLAERTRCLTASRRPKKYKTGVSRTELACKIGRAENVDLYQTGPAEPRSVKISRFRAREEAS
jgi:hypothetical protein